MSEKSTAMLYVLVADLFFRSKIRAVAEAAGVALQFVRSFDELPTMLAASAAPARIIVDLNDRSLRAVNFLPALSQDPRIAELIGFVSHVDVATTNAARAAGCTVMPKSQFVENLPAILAGEFGA